MVDLVVRLGTAQDDFDAVGCTRQGRHADHEPALRRDDDGLVKFDLLEDRRRMERHRVFRRLWDAVPLVGQDVQEDWPLLLLEVAEG